MAVCWLLVAGCASDLSITEASNCDGRATRDEKSVDAPFDRDGDGYFDGSNKDCQAAYDATQLDCDETNADIHPGAEEIACDGLDNDCSAETEDAPDVDQDGSDACDDCDDTNNTVHPGGTEFECDGLDNDCDPTTEDGTTDTDGDHYNACEDCDDHNSAVNPNREEIACNTLDDDCDAATPDGDDLDQDGFDECDDCDDYDNQAWPGHEEVCDDKVDNNCNGDVDENCSTTYTGTWTADTYMSYSCAYGLVAIGFNQMILLDAYPSLTVSESTSQQPGTMTGSFTSGSTFSVVRTIAGTCTETYTMTGTFTDANHFDGTFTAAYPGGRLCFGCTTQTWNFTASR